VILFCSFRHLYLLIRKVMNPLVVQAGEVIGNGREMISAAIRLWEL